MMHSLTSGGAWLLAGALVASSCASIPPESVELSQRLGDGIAEARTAHLATLDAFYQRMKSENDRWVAESFLPRLIENYASRLATACEEAGDSSPDCSALGSADVASLVRETVLFRDELQAALEKSRDQAHRLIDDHYADLNAANAAITALLGSAVDTRNAVRDASGTASRVTGLEIDTDAIERAVAEYLEAAGQHGASISQLEERLSEILSGGKERP